MNDDHIDQTDGEQSWMRCKRHFIWGIGFISAINFVAAIIYGSIY